MGNHFQKYGSVYVIILLCIVSRLPQLFSPHFVLDGDEAIVGLMSKHFIEGKELPLFFYGQQYGFAFIEVLTVSVGYLIGGISDYSVKLSVFALWIAGVVFFYKSLQVITKEQKLITLLVTVLLILSPAWAVWAMKARGGYITAFTFSNVVLYILLKNKQGVLPWFIAGLFSMIVFYSQPLWLAGLLPLVVYALWNNRKWSAVFIYAIGGVLFFTVITLLKKDGVVTWQPDVFPVVSWERIAQTPGYIYDNLTGFYYLQHKDAVPGIVAAFVYGLVIMLLLAVVYAFITGVRHSGKNKSLLFAGSLSLLGVVAYNSIIDVASPRYALPFIGYALVFVAIVWSHVRKNLLTIPLLVLVFLGVVAIIKFKDYKIPDTDKAELQLLVGELQQNDITHVYTQGPLLQWHISFYSKEQVIARYLYPVDRHMPYIAAVDSCYVSAPGHTALVGYRSQAGNDANVVSIGEKYYLYKKPPQNLLDYLGFQISPNSRRVTP